MQLISTQKRTDRASILVPQKQKGNDQKVRFITNYNMQWRNIRELFDQIWPILSTDLDLRHHLSPRPQLTAKRAQMFGNMMIHSHYVPK